MYRTTTTATLLVTVAVSALSGCMTVHRPTAPGSPSAPSGSAAPPHHGRAEPQIAQAPAREALGRSGPSGRPSSAAPPRRPTAPALQVPRAAAPAAPPRRDRPAAPPEPRHRKPRAAAPSGTSDLPKGPDVCGLGRKYGGWSANSPEAVICTRTYGH
ncbi:hypothetical protein [Streptomyces sp. NPDC002580]|uniref:hypothetical protein n=1 Tax=Streptomyces sp. NPDC002580 TaxID=3364653 RepID=UPI0036B77F0A